MVDPEAGPGVDPETGRAAEAGTVAGTAATMADAAATMAYAADQVVDQRSLILGYTTMLGRCIPQYSPFFFYFSNKINPKKQNFSFFFVMF